MPTLNLICIDDQREVLASLEKELGPLEAFVDVHPCESAEEATEVLEDLDAEGKTPSLIICDHVMPGKNGIEFLTEISQDGRFSDTRKILLTGQATHSDTITAINHARIDRYIEKPWKPERLLTTIKVLLTEYILHQQLDYLPYQQIIDQETLFRLLKNSC